jgi:hypothetical protein
MNQYFDTLGLIWDQVLLADKVYSGFTATATAYGDQKTTMLAM